MHRLMSFLTSSRRFAIIVALGAISIAVPAAAQSQKAPAKQAPAASSTTPAAPQAENESKPAPYDSQMMRLAEVLGSVTYLRSLCGATSDDWRGSMQKLLDSDTANEPKRRERLTAAYNRGYRSFAAVHATCSEPARMAEELYRAEGATLAAEIASRYGN
jgi:uncharacterized protein (TIGR02301 family)